MKAVEVSEPDVTFNHWELGREFWEWSSDQQADFLHGMTTAAYYGKHSNAMMQLQFIADHLNDDPYAYGEVVEFIEELAARLKGEGR